MSLNKINRGNRHNAIIELKLTDDTNFQEWFRLIQIASLTAEYISLPDFIPTANMDVIYSSRILKEKYPFYNQIVNLTLRNPITEIKGKLLALQHNGVKNILVVKGDSNYLNRLYLTYKNGQEIENNEPYNKLLEKIKSLPYDKYWTKTSLAIKELKEMDTKTNIGSTCNLGHVKEKKWEKELRNIELKVRAKTDFFQTQANFDLMRGLEHYDILKKTYPGIPIYFGLMQIRRKKDISFFEKKLGINIPDQIKKRINKHISNSDIYREGEEIFFDFLDSLIQQDISYVYYALDNKRTLNQLYRFADKRNLINEEALMHVAETLG
ncbi:MAG: hypothetical protein GF308_07415 [Candidatus Heimdallarchaeota archaeon]|nr:hypothetical protein [Candidatus Heimdallarchaeota archaeon]